MNILHIKTAYRNITRNPFYSSLNIISFTLSMSISLVAVLIIYNQFNFDRGNANRDRIYRLNTQVTTDDGDRGIFATVPYRTKDLVDPNGIEDYVNLTPIKSYLIAAGNTEVASTGAWVEGDYFKLFNFKILAGSYQSLADNPKAIALSATTCMKLFNTTECTGKLVNIKELGDFVVSVVYDNTAFKSVVTNDYLVSYRFVPTAVATGIVDSNFAKVSNYTASYCYVQLSRQASPQALNGNLAQITKKMAGDFQGAGKVKEIAVKATSLSDLAPRTDYWLETSPALSGSEIFMLISVIAVLIILTSFNYTSILMALGIARGREIGIRRLIGANRIDIFYQFVLEAIITALIALVFAVLLLPLVQQVPPFDRMALRADIDYQVIGYFVLFAILAGVLAGTVPALIVSSQNSLRLLRGILKNPALKRFSLQKIVVVIQFSLCSAMVLVAVMLFRQSKFMAESDYGFSYKNIVSIAVNDSAENALLRAELAKWSEVTAISGISTNLGHMPTEEFEAFTARDKSKKVNTGSFFIDDHSIPELGIRLIAGSNFDGAASFRNNQVIANESLVHAIGFAHAADAIGSVIFLDDTTTVRIQGVVQDFHFQNFKRAIAPMLFRYDVSRLAFVNARVHPDRLDALKIKLASVGFRQKIGRPVEFVLWDREFRDHQAHGETLVMISFFTMVLLGIASLSLIGIVSYSTFQQAKEISIRKVLGATLYQVFFALTREYFVLVLVALCFGLPIGCLLSNLLVNGFAYRVNVNAGAVVLSMIGVGFFTVCILALTTYRRCRMKPAVSLRKV